MKYYRVMLKVQGNTILEYVSAPPDEFSAIGAIISFYDEHYANHKVLAIEEVLYVDDYMIDVHL